MAVTAFWYGLGVKQQWNSTAADRVVWPGATDTHKVSLHTSAYAYNQDTDNYFNNTTNEITGTNYVAGGYQLANKTLNYDTASNETRLDADDAVWATASFTANRAVIYKSTGVSTTSLLMGYVLFGADQTVATATFTIQWDATGVLKVTAS